MRASLASARRLLAAMPHLLIALAFAAGPAAAEDWPRWRGPRGDGTWNGPKLPERWPAEGLKRLWKQPIGGGYAGVVVADGRVVTMDYAKSPRESERVVCFDAESGKLLWEHRYDVQYGKLDYGSGPRAAPTIHNGRIYTLGAVGHVHCLDAATGERRWSRDCVKELKAKISEWGFAASPVIHKELVIVHVAAQPGGCLVALDQATGREVWRAGNDPAGYATPIVVTRAGRPQLVAWTPEHVLGIDPDSGEIEWQVPYKVTYGVSIATPIYQEELVFVSGYWEGSKAIRAPRDARGGELAWEENENLRGLMSQPLYRQGHVYTLDKSLGLTCFELQTGKKLWDDGNTLTPRGRNPQATLVWLGDGDRVIALNSEGELVLARLSPRGYLEQSRTNIIGPTWAHPAYAGRRVYARNDEELVCVELPVK